MKDKNPRSKREESGGNGSADEKVVMIRLTDLHPFPNHPFKVREDESMNETVERTCRKIIDCHLFIW